MKIESVKKLTPFRRLLYWIEERDKIRLLKEVNKPKPWTDDEILQNYRFCNVRRMDDKVSRWLDDNWYTPHYDHHNALLACALARFINKPESLKLIEQWVYREGSPDYGQIKKVLRRHRDDGNTVFNGAYMVRGNDGMDKIECVVDYYVKPLMKVLKGGLPTDTMKEAWLKVKASYGMGSFMAGQVIADLRHAISGDWADKLYWAPIGPGSQRGMNRLLGRLMKSPIPQEEFETLLLTQVIVPCKAKLSESIHGRLEAIDWQNCLCEFDKYERTLFDNRRPKSRYPGV